MTRETGSSVECCVDTLCGSRCPRSLDSSTGYARIALLATEDRLHAGGIMDVVHWDCTGCGDTGDRDGICSALPPGVPAGAARDPQRHAAIRPPDVLVQAPPRRAVLATPPATPMRGGGV